jgi:hypothetical protein
MPPIDLTARARDYSLYLPSIQDSSASRICMEPGQWADLPASLGIAPCEFNYLDPNNKYWSYTCALASAETFRGGSNNAITRRDPGTLVLGDSGGFQIGNGKGATKKWNNYSEADVTSAWRRSRMLPDITDWCEANCDGAMTLDLPLWARRPKSAGTPFHQCSVARLIELTLENLEYLHDRENKRCKYLNVLQGDKPADEVAWYDSVKRFDFDGWSLAGGVGVDGGPYRVLRRLLLLRDEKKLDPGFDWVHVLKLSQFPWAPLMTAVQRAVRRFAGNPEFVVTYDSSTPYSSAGHREQYYHGRSFTSDPKSWRNPPYKFPSLYCHAVGKTAAKLDTVTCASSPCALCQQGKPHLPAPLSSPLARTLSLGDVVNVADQFVTRRVQTLFDEVLINHNVYTIVEALIRLRIVSKNCGVVESVAVGEIDDIDAFAHDIAHGRGRIVRRFPANAVQGFNQEVGAASDRSASDSFEKTPQSSRLNILTLERRNPDVFVRLTAFDQLKAMSLGIPGRRAYLAPEAVTFALFRR